MFFSAEALSQIQAEYLTVAQKYRNLLIQYVSRRYENPRSHEYAKHGFSRRLKTLARCIHNVYETLPPDRTKLPTFDELSDATINLQAFVFNVFGAIDNLAWIWVSEKNVLRSDGSPIPPRWVGLGPSNTLVRESFSQHFTRYLDEMGDWFSHLENFRHALAHQIPLYIPPFVVLEGRQADFEELENRMADALTQHNFRYYWSLLDQQQALAEFRPIMTHSFEARSRFVVFHSQILADFNTVDELGRKLLEELDR